MYGEMPVVERRGFESHLSDCHVCTDEFASVSLARFEVFDWKRVEFDVLATPTFVVPYTEKADAFGEGVSGWLSWPTLVPAFALFLIAAFAGVAVWVFRNNPAQPVVAVSVPASIEKAPVTVEPLTSAPDVLARKDVDLVSPAKASAKQTRKATTIPRVQFAKGVAPRIRLSSDVALNTQVPVSKKMPRLGVYEDDNDTSLRLAQLLDETGPPEE